jgi:YacP-like NYN domain
MPYWFDGNNLVGQPAAQLRSDRRTRRAFLEFLSSCAGSRRARFIVFFDGDDPDHAMPPRGVQVRYSAPLSTDDAILRRLAEIRIPAEVTIVTNDRSLSDRCAALKARGMDWAEFAARMKRRASSGCKDEPVDVGEWADYFGLEGDSLE